MIEPVEMFSATCDNCKDLFLAHGEFSALSTEEDVQDELKESGWAILINGKCYCAQCHTKEPDADTEELWAISKKDVILGKIEQ